MEKNLFDPRFGDVIPLVQLLSRVWLSDSKDCSMPGFPVFHHLLGFAQTHIHWLWF